MTYQFDVYSLGIFGGGCSLGALEYSLDHLLNWCRDEEETEAVIHGLHNLDEILQFDYTAGGTRHWYDFSLC